MHHALELDTQCPDCGGTGVYVGLAEHTGAGVVCRKCNGTGRYTFRYEYDDFEGRKWRDGVQRILEANPGICVGEGNGHTLEEFGGMSYAEWYAGGVFPPKSEMRRYTCPAWWYQFADYSRKPNWDECPWGFRFRACKLFPNKAACWARWDQEQGQE